MDSAATLTLMSNYFGAMDCAESSLFHFPRGLPGFENERQFAAIEIPEQHPLVYLQSIHRPDLCLITLPAHVVCPEFQLELQPDDAHVLGFSDSELPQAGENVLCLAIISVDERRDPVANLLAPLVVNVKTRDAVQAVQEDSIWSCEHPLPEAAC